jgi:molybdopterin-guanine dinucleotide biosynthesis protein A
MEKISLAIQAGGSSSRMGRDKGLLPIGSITLIEHILTQVQPLGYEIFVISNSPEKYEFLDLPVYSDIYADIGALGGIHTILTYSKTPYVFALACDMPFINSGLIEYMISLRKGNDIVIPVVGERGFMEPFRALYSQNCLNAVDQAILRGERRVISFFEGLNIARIQENEIHQFDPDEETFININTPEEYERVVRMLEDQGGR